MSNSVDSDQPCFTEVHNWLARLRFRDRARPDPKWPLVTRLLGEPHHVRNVQRNVNRGLLGGLVVRDPSAPCADYEIPIFVHQMQASAKGYFFRSEELRPYDEGRQTSRGAGAPQGPGLRARIPGEIGFPG